MIERYCRMLWLVAVLGAGVLPAHAQDSGLRFLRFGTNAAALAMGDAAVAASQDAFSTFWNPAGLATVPTNSAAASHRIWVGDLRTYDLAARFRAGRNGGLGLAVTAVDSGDLDGFDPTGEPTGTFSAQFVSVGLSYGRRLGPLHVGATAKYLSERIFDESASGYGFDFGAQLGLLDGGVRFGAALQNLGEMNELANIATELPLTLRAGVAAYPFHLVATDGGAVLDLSLVAEVSHLFPDEATRFHGGIGAEVLELLSFRAGYITNDDLRDLTFGGGLRYAGLVFDYAFLPFNTGFGTGHVLTLHYNW